MQHELAFAAAVDNDLPSAREAYVVSRGKVTGNGRKAEEGYVAALLAAEGGPNAAAATLHLDNFSGHGAQEAATLSFERLWQWRTEGKFAEWNLPVDFFSKFAKAAARSGETERARSVYEEAASRFQPSDDYFAMILDFAEFHRKQGETAEAATLLSRRLKDAPPAFRSEVRFAQARVAWKAGRLDEARKEFLEIAEGAARRGTADRARYLAAWIMEDAGDLAGATEEFGRLVRSQDDSTRQEALFRHAYGLFRQKRYDEAIVAFAAGEKGGFGTVESARHRYWRARSLREAGRGAEADACSGISPGTPSPGRTPSSPRRRSEEPPSGSSTPLRAERRRRAARSGIGSGRGCGARIGARRTPRRCGARNGLLSSARRTMPSSRRSVSTARRRGRRSGWETAVRRASSGTLPAISGGGSARRRTSRSIRRAPGWSTGSNTPWRRNSLRTATGNVPGSTRSSSTRSSGRSRASRRTPSPPRAPSG